MQQGNGASALAARTAGMTDEQILDLDLGALETSSPGLATNNVAAPWATTPLPAMAGDAEPRSNLPASQRTGQDDMAILDEAEARSANAQRETSQKTSQGEAIAQGAQDEPAWLKQLEAQPQAAAEARQWRDAARDVAALDAAYFSGDAGARGGLAARLYESDPAAFREMLVESARMLASRDPQALAELARQLGVNQAQAPDAPAKSLAQAARSLEANAAAQNQVPAGTGGDGAFPAGAYRAFESATNEDVARATRDAIDRTLSSTLPEGIGDGARRRIGEDIFQELHATLSADHELSRQIGDILRGWNFDGATRQQVASVISARARAAMPEVARRVIAEWTSSVLASDRARAARVDAAASRRDITGGHLPATIPATALIPRKIDYSKMSDEQILDL
jgi:hypothetical protein